MGNLGLGTSIRNLGNNAADTMAMSAVRRPNVVPLLLYTRAEQFLVPCREGQQITAEDLCIRAATECGITRLGLSLFAVYDNDGQTWLSPASLVGPANRGLVFRLRFHMPPSRANVTSLPESVLAYMFAQYRHDFRQDRIGDITMEESLGLVVLDMVCHAREHDIPTDKCLHSGRFKTFLPKSLSKDLKMLDKWKLKRKIHKSLGEFDLCQRDVNGYRMLFLISLMEENKSWGTETFETVHDQQYAISIAKRGIEETAQPKEQAKKFELLFEDVISVGMIASRQANSSNWIVIVNQRNTAPKDFVMKDKQAAASVVSLIDGYCRLQVDYYHYLFLECAPPSLVQLIKTRCHGPIPLSCAKRKIEEAGPDDGIYLIRQNPEDFKSHCLTVRMNNSIRNYKIIINDDGSYSLPDQKRFPDVAAFAQYYRNSSNSSCLEAPLTRMLSYQSKERSLLMQDMAALPEAPKSVVVEPPIEWIHEDKMTKRRKLGEGQFTVVCRGEISKRDKGWIQVAIKHPKEDASQEVKQYFSQSVDIMSTWCSQSIVKFYGVGAGFSLIIEYAHYGPLDIYLRTNHSKVTSGDQVAMATQLIDGLHYLESRNIVHGNVSAHNVLVSKSSPRVRVKLGDPMLAMYFHSLHMCKKMERVRWTAPELLQSHTKPTLQSDRWSFGIALWQIMALGQIPFKEMTDEEVFKLYVRGQFPKFPASSTEALNTLMCACLQMNRDARPTCKQLLRDLNRIYMRYQDYEASAIYSEVSDDEGPEEIMEDLSECEDEEDNRAEVGQGSSPSPFNGPLSPGLRADGRGANKDEMGSTTSNRMLRFIGIEKVPEGRLEIGESIGSGQFGVVHYGTWQRSPIEQVEVAIKTIKNESEEERKQFEDEIRQMSLCYHKNIVKVFGIMEVSGWGKPLKMVMEYMPLGSLRSFLLKKKDGALLTLSTMLTFSQQVAEGMVYLGRMRVVHRDLAVRNVLVVSDATETTEPMVKITDFGLARDYTDNNYYIPAKKDAPLPMIRYAVECFGENKKFSVQSDVWSFGILLWEIFNYGKTPEYVKESGNICPLSELEFFLYQGNRLDKPPGAPEVLYTLMRDCWHLDKHKRPTFINLVEWLGEMLLSEPNLSCVVRP